MVHVAVTLYTKDPDMSQGRDFPYNPILGMGCFDHQSYSRKGSGFLGIHRVSGHLCPIQAIGPSLFSSPTFASSFSMSILRRFLDWRSPGSKLKHPKNHWNFLTIFEIPWFLGQIEASWRLPPLKTSSSQAKMEKWGLVEDGEFPCKIRHLFRCVCC